MFPLNLFFFFATYLLPLYFFKVIAQEKGPYNIILESIKNCENQGSGEMSFISTARKEGKEVFHSGEVKMPFGLADNFKAEGEATIWTNGKWKPIGLIWKLGFPQACSSMKTLVPVWFDILKAANVNNLSCPIKKGNYKFTNYQVKGSIKGMDSLKYGKYRVQVPFIKRGKRVGCVAYFADVVPK